jgi:transmembrane sensor
LKKNITPTELFKRYLDDASTPEEIDGLIGYFGTSSEKDLRKSINDALRKGNDPESLSTDLQQHLAGIYKNIVPQLKTEVAVIPIPFYKRRAFIYLTAACIALVVTGIAAMFHNNYPNVKFKDLAAEFISHDLPPGGHRAILTLADGKTITLNEAADGELVRGVGMVIRKTGNGQLVYEVAGSNDIDVKPNTYNTISTPNGGTYQVILPDGTKVWLNAASTLRFPTSFVSLKDRKIELSGEAYFEVTKDAKHPFRVLTAKQEVQVLGTDFNISSYVDESTVKTTLFEGSLKVNHLQKIRSADIILKPGQQSIINNGVISITKADMDEVLAWKNGVFVFNDEPLESIMKKVSRWYDVDVVYQGVDKNKLFEGSVSRFDNVSKVLRQLELTGGVHFKIEEGRIIAMK